MADENVSVGGLRAFYDESAETVRLSVEGKSTGLTITADGGTQPAGDLTLATGDLTVTAGDVTVTAGDTTLASMTLASGPTLKATTVAVTASEIRTMAASPKTLVAAQAGIAYVFQGAFVRYTGGANVFDSVGAGEDFAIKYTNASGQTVSAALDTTSDINLGSTADDEAWMPPLATTVNPVTNAALVMDQIGAGELATTDDDSDGDGTLSVTVYYLELS